MELKEVESIGHWNWAPMKWVVGEPIDHNVGDPTDLNQWMEGDPHKNLDLLSWGHMDQIDLGETPMLELN